MLSLVLIIPDFRSFLNFPATVNNEALFLLPHVPVGDRILYKHQRKYYSVVQDGMDVALSFLEVCGVLLGTPGVSLDRFFSKQKNREFKLKYLKKLFATKNILCLQEVHGKDKYLQSIQVLARDLGFFGTFFFLLKTKTREGRLSAFTGIFFLKKLL